MNNAATGLRVSTADQDPRIQEAALLEFAERRELENVRQFELHESDLEG